MPQLLKAAMFEFTVLGSLNISSYIVLPSSPTPSVKWLAKPFGIYRYKHAYYRALEHVLRKISIRGVHILQKSKNHLRILGARKVTLSRYCAGGLQIWRATLPNLVAPATCSPGFEQRCFVYRIWKVHGGKNSEHLLLGYDTMRHRNLPQTKGRIFRLKPEISGRWRFIL
jgi:hypothetical protein